MSVLDPPFGLSLGGWNVWQKLQDNIPTVESAPETFGNILCRNLSIAVEGARSENGGHNRMDEQFDFVATHAALVRSAPLQYSLASTILCGYQPTRVVTVLRAGSSAAWLEYAGSASLDETEFRWRNQS